jgi:hypothetical protein
VFTKLDINQINPSLEDKTHYEITTIDNSHKLESYFFSNINSKKLVVLLQGAVERSKRELPIYHRWTWAEDLHTNVLSLNNPLLYKSDDLTIGWYVGASNFDYTIKYTKFIRDIASKLGVKTEDILLFGSSAGGFAAMKFATNLKGAIAVVNNPQTNILKYHKGHVDKFLRVAFNNMSFEKVEELYKARLDVISYFASKSYVPEIVYYQNRHDDFHYKNHYQPFLKNVDELGLPINVKYVVYHDKERGHGPLKQNIAIKAINHAMNHKFKMIEFK